MADDSTSNYEVRSSGLWSPRHVIAGPDGPLGVLTVQRNGLGMVVSARFQPEKGEVLHFRRDPGILRSQFSLWTEGREWLGSSLRRNFVRRDVEIWIGSTPFRVIPLEGFRRGWRLLAPKTGELARVYAPFGRPARIEVLRRTETELLLFTWFLASQILFESVWPGPAIDATPESLAPTKAC
jgi:hypothetical protein